MWWSMPLTGTYARNLDDKHRLAIPKRLCDDFCEIDLKSLFIAPGVSRSLTLYSPAGFERLSRKLARKPANPAQRRTYTRLFYSAAERVELDAQGRVRIPERLVEFAGLERDVVLLGVLDHVEIWDAAIWNKFAVEQNLAFDEIADQAWE